MIPPKVEYVERGLHFFVKVEGSFISCVSCGSPMEHNKIRGRYYANHKCSARHEAAKKSANTRHLALGIERTESYGKRLSDGFDLVSEAE